MRPGQLLQELSKASLANVVLALGEPAVRGMSRALSCARFYDGVSLVSIIGAEFRRVGRSYLNNASQVVVHDGKILEKPRSPDEVGAPAQDTKKGRKDEAYETKAQSKQGAPVCR